MNRRHIPQARRDAAVADYRTSGDSYTVVAARHGVSKAALNAWVNGKVTKSRGPFVWPEHEIALGAGRWVPNGRGTVVWEAAS